MARPIHIDPNKEYPVHVYIEETRKRLVLELMMLDDFQNYVTKHFKTIPGYLIRNQRNQNRENMRLYKKRKSSMFYNAHEQIQNFKNVIKQIKQGDRLPWK